MELQERKYKYYISGLKGIACLGIMFGHYLGIYRYAEVFSPDLPLIDTISNSVVAFVTGEKWWLYLFLVVSGYLVAQSKIKNLWELFIKCISRFFRLAFPILFAYIVIYVVYLCVGFHAEETESIFQCAWFQGYYHRSYSLETVLEGPVSVLLKGKTGFNAPYWVLKDMFIGSIVIYIFNYIRHRFIKNKQETIYFCLLLVIAVSLMWISKIVAAGLFGMLIALFEDREKEMRLCIVLGLIVLLNMVYALPEQLVFSAGWGVILILVPKVKWLTNLLSGKIVLYLEKISWGIYSFHWPLMCSIGALGLIKMSTNWGLRNAYIAVVLFSAVITILVSIVFSKSFGRLADYLSNMVTRILRRAIERIS